MTSSRVAQRLEASSSIASLLVDSCAESLGVIERERRHAVALDVLETSVDPIAVYDSGVATPRFTNAAWRALAGELPANERAQIDVVGRTGTSYVIEELALVRSGYPIYCAAQLRPLRGCLGAPIGTIVVLAVITDEVIARRLGSHRHALVWGGPLGGQPDYYGASWFAYTGDDPDAPPKSWYRAVHPEDMIRCMDAIHEAEVEAIDVRLRRADGTYRWHRLRTMVDGARWSIAAVDNHDAHEVGEIRADAEHAAALKDQAIATISHELRAPVMTMLLWIDILEDRTSTPEIRERAMAALRASATAQSRLVGDLLDASRAISGKLIIAVRRFDFAATVRDALAAVATGNVTIESRGLDEPCEIDGDHQRLRQVLDNLMSNALKFTPPHGKIVVELRVTEPTIELVITDTGCGIAPEVMPIIFEPFNQTDDPLTREGSGLGLGLAIARKIVTLHGGTLVATSPGRGHGTTLHVSLPNQRLAAPARVRVRDARTLKGVHVLVVDDDSRVREALGVLFSRTGARVSTADSAAEGRTAIEIAVPDVIVCDLAMPGEDGYSFIKKLRGSRQKIPAIALTAHANANDVLRSLEAGFDVHLGKPIDFEKLVQQITELVSVT